VVVVSLMIGFGDIRDMSVARLERSSYASCATFAHRKRAGANAGPENTPQQLGAARGPLAAVP